MAKKKRKEYDTSVHKNETSFKPGNKANEKYTEKEALQFFKESLEKLKEDKDIFFIGTLATKMNTYRQLYFYLYQKYGEKNPEFDSIKQSINSIIEERLFHKAYTDKNYNATMAIFGLKNNHDWSDKQIVDHRTNDKDITPFTFYQSDKDK